MWSSSSSSSSSSSHPRRAHARVSIVGSAVPCFLVFLLGLSSSTVVEGLSVSPIPETTTTTNNNNNNNVIAITHAAGRMGKVLALQLREDAALRHTAGIHNNDNDDDDETSGSSGPGEENQTDDSHLPIIRAIVRSEEEAHSVKCDLGGMKMVSGCIARPIELDWLETIVVDSKLEATQRADLLREAFEGCRAAVLCDASHNELVWNDGGATTTTSSQAGFSMVVPAAESRDLSERLLEEISAAGESTTLEHLVLRSTMGLAVSRAAEAHRRYTDQNPLVPFEGEIDWKALEASMGGEAALAGPRAAERAFRRMAERKRKRRHVVLRLGALTDDAGMVPLVFGTNDSILVRTADDGTDHYKPPILSRSDAARVSTVLVRNDNNDNDPAGGSVGVGGGNLWTIDCAWHPKYGRDSVGREETIAAAARQDLEGSILEALPEAEPSVPSR